MKRIVPKRKDLYRMLIVVAIALVALFWLTPQLSSASNQKPATVAQTNAPVGGVSGGNMPMPVPSSFNPGTSSATTVPAENPNSGVDVPQGFAPPAYETPPQNTPLPNSPDGNP